MGLVISVGNFLGALAEISCRHKRAREGSLWNRIWFLAFFSGFAFHGVLVIGLSMLFYLIGKVLTRSLSLLAQFVSFCVRSCVI